MRPGFLSRLARLGMLVAGASSGLPHVVVSAQPAPELAPPPSERIVVLTFANSSGEPEHEWIGTGLAETIVTDLESLGTLQVVAQETTRATMLESGESALDDADAAALGRELDARWVVLGLSLIHI